MKAMALCAVVALICSAAERYPVPRFTDAARREKLARAYPLIDEVLSGYMRQRGIPGLVYGVVIDGELAHVKAFGVSDRSSNTPVTPKTVFRIASMTKSFTALAVLKLRDEGKLSLDDPVSKWIPEFAKFEYPTRDTPILRIRHLLTHSAGFPEDNPWGDQQLGITDQQLDRWLAARIPFSTTPGTTFEYSNYGFALAGRIVAKVSKRPYREYLEMEILRPLGMKSSTLEPSAVPREAHAVGYRRTPDRQYSEEPSLPHGAFGAMGGLLTSAEDLGRYVAFMLDAWPPRDDAERGPVRRSSVREMQQIWRLSDFSADRVDGGAVQASLAGYGYGLRMQQDCRFAHIAGHGGGLPGFGSYMLWLPEYGVGLFAMANLTYAGPAGALHSAFDKLAETGGLQPRVLPASPALSAAREAIFQLWKHWDEKDAARLAADNLFRDIPAAERRRRIDSYKKLVGECRTASTVEPENWLRGSFRLQCEGGEVGVTFTLAPTAPPSVQYLAFLPAVSLKESLRQEIEKIALAEAGRYGKCEIGRVLSGDGGTNARVRLECSKGAVNLTFGIDNDGKRSWRFSKAPGMACGL